MNVKWIYTTGSHHNHILTKCCRDDTEETERERESKVREQELKHADARPSVPVPVVGVKQESVFMA